MADNPSFEALIPGLADSDLQQVVAARRLTQSTSILIGPAIGGVLVSIFGARTTLASASLLYVVGLAALVTLRGIDTSLHKRRAAQAGDSPRAVMSSTLDGLRIIRDTPFARRMLTYWASAMAGVAVAMLAALVWFKRDLQVRDVWYGISIGAYGVGALLGLVWAGGRTFRMPLPSIMRRAIPIYAAFAAVAVAFHTPWLMLLSWFGWGVAMGPEIVVGETALVELIPEAARGRVSAAQAIIVQVGLAVGYGIGGPLVDRLGARAATLVSAAATLALLVFWIGPLQPLAKEAVRPGRMMDHAFGDETGAHESAL
jgi:MFS family permease